MLPVEGGVVLPEPMFWHVCVLEAEPDGPLLEDVPDALEEPDDPLFEDVPDALEVAAPGVEAAVSVEVEPPDEVVDELVVAVAAEIPRPRLSPTALAAIPAANRGRLNFIPLILLTRPR